EQAALGQRVTNVENRTARAGYSAATEQAISFDSRGRNRAVLTTVTPPTDILFMEFLFRMSSSNVWGALVKLDYSIWSGFAPVLAGTVLSSDNSRAFIMDISGGGALENFLFVGKGVGDVICLSTVLWESDRLPNRFSVRWYR
ncbi:MAG: hypothetical protein OXE46_02905, partial [Chloroflexi bacterium]|nr:hypothetical protein [Chloroflexota bacterium]